MRALAGAIVLVPAVAAAQPDTVHVDVSVDIEASQADAPPGLVAESPAPATPSADPGRFELALHVGLTRATQAYKDYDVYEQPGPRGTGLAVDGSVGVRLRPWLSVGAFAALSTIQDNAVRDTYDRSYDIRDWFVDLGAHARFHVSGAFFGPLLGLEEIRAEYDWRDGSGTVSKRWFTGTLVGLEGGYTWRERDGVRPEVVLGLTQTSVSLAGDVFPRMMMSSSVVAARAAIGVRF